MNAYGVLRPRPSKVAPVDVAGGSTGDAQKRHMYMGAGFSSIHSHVVFGFRPRGRPQRRDGLTCRMEAGHFRYETRYVLD